MKSIGNLVVWAVCVGLVTQGGTMRAADIRLGHMKAEKILFLGNSITAVPQRNATVLW